MPIAKIQLPDGKIAKFEVPDGTTQEQVLSYAKDFKPEEPKQSPVFDVAQAASDKAGGLVSPGQLLSQVVDPGRGFKEGVTKLGTGIKQLGLEIGEGAGIVQPGTAEQYTQGESVRRQEAAKSLEGIPGQNISQAAGEYGPMAFVPGGAQRTALARLMTGAGQGAAVGGTQFVEPGGSRALNTSIGAVGGGGGNVALGKLADMGSAKVTELLKQKSLNQVRDRVMNVGKKHGYRVPPTQVNPSKTNTILEGQISGMAKTHQALAKHNQEITNKLARKAIGLDELDAISIESLSSVRTKAGKVYDKLEKFTDNVDVDAAYLKELDDIAQPQIKGADSFGGEGNKEILKIVKDYSKSGFTPKQGVEELKRLRFKAKTHMKSMENPELKELAGAEKKVANAIEGMLERSLESKGDDALMAEFRAARKQIAKTYSVEDALTQGSGNVNAHKLAKQLEKGAPLEGELKDAAAFAQTFKPATAEITGSKPGMSVVDGMMALGLAGGGGAGLGPGGLALGALPYVRPIVRKGITSGPYQKMMTNPKYSSLTAELLKKGNNVSPAILGRASQYQPLIDALGTNNGNGQ